MGPRFIVANPGTHPEMVHLTSALSTANQHVELLTSSMWAAGSPLLSALQRRSGGKLSDNLSARRLPDAINSRDVHNLGWIPETFFQLGRRTLPATSEPLLRFRNKVFAARSAKYVSSISGNLTLIAQQTCALPLFEASGNNVMRILNYPIAHHRWADSYMTAEGAENPHWAPFLQGQGLSEEYAQRLDREIELADFILVASSFVARTFVEAGVPARKVGVVPLGCSMSAGGTMQSIGPQQGRPLRVLFAGQVNQRKGISYYLDALAQLPSGAVEARIVGPTSNEMRERLKSYPRLEALGEATQTELSQHYIWADVILLPSLIEGFGLTALDAMSHGRPVIVTTHTFAGDVITNGIDGFIVSPRSSAELVQVLEDCLGGQHDLSEIGHRAAIRARQFSWASYGESVVQLLLEITSQREG